VNTNPLNNIPKFLSPSFGFAMEHGARTQHWVVGDEFANARLKMLMTCAIPRASLRSVFTTIADSAALTWRVSKSTTSYPAWMRPLQ
jgi:hypothetical protein